MILKMIKIRSFQYIFVASLSPYVNAVGVVAVMGFHCTLIVYTSCKMGVQGIEQSYVSGIQYLSVEKTVLHKVSLASPFWQNKPGDHPFSLQNMTEECQDYQNH